MNFDKNEYEAGTNHGMLFGAIFGFFIGLVVASIFFKDGIVITATGNNDNGTVSVEYHSVMNAQRRSLNNITVDSLFDFIRDKPIHK